MSNFQPLEVVDRGSETQPQVGENLNKLTWQDKSYNTYVSSDFFHIDLMFASTVMIFFNIKT